MKRSLLMAAVVVLIVISLASFVWLYGLWGSFIEESSNSRTSPSGKSCHYETKYRNRQDTIINSQFIVDAGHYRYKTFVVESDWINPRLEITVRVYEGKDVKLILLKDGQIYWKTGLIGPYYHTTLDLPGKGAYEIQIDNSYSIITDKNVEAKIILYYKEKQVVEVCG